MNGNKPLPLPLDIFDDEWVNLFKRKLNVVENDTSSRPAKKSKSGFGKKKKWIQETTKSFEKKGTKGAFTKWCKSKGFSGVSNECIKLGKQSKSLRTRRRAVFAENVK